MKQLISDKIVLRPAPDAPKNTISLDGVEPNIVNGDKKFSKPKKGTLVKWIKRICATAAVTVALVASVLFVNNLPEDFKLPFNSGEPTATQKIENVKSKMSTEKDVYKNLKKMGIGSEIVTKNDEGITRFYTTGDPTTVCVSDDFTAEEKQAIEESIDIYNKVFEQINPNYKFVVEYGNQCKSEGRNTEKIEVKTTGDLEGNTVAYESSYSIYTRGDYGLKTSENEIYMGKASRDDLAKFKNSFLHEFMHALGVEDAYIIENFYQGTIMNCTSSGTKTKDLYKYDVALLAALYGDFSSEENINKMIEFINNYENGKSYTDTSSCKSETTRKGHAVEHKTASSKVSEEELGLAK